MKSPVVKRSIVIAGHKTSVSLEDAFWTGLKEIAAERHVTLSDMVALIDQDRRHGNLSSAVRLFVLDHFRAIAGGALLGWVFENLPVESLGVGGWIHSLAMLAVAVISPISNPPTSNRAPSILS